jgi:hypothetical protein
MFPYEGGNVAAQVGLWIDHRKAVIVTVSGEGEATRLVESNVEKRVRYSGGARSGTSHESRQGTNMTDLVAAS